MNPKYAFHEILKAAEALYDPDSIECVDAAVSEYYALRRMDFDVKDMPILASMGAFEIPDTITHRSYTGTTTEVQLNTKPTNPKDAIGSTKPPLSCVSFPVMYEIGSAMLEGACKYGRHNYREAGVRVSVYVDACMRHIARYWEGEDIDPDSGISHLTKAAACLVVIRDAQINGMVQWDDRPPKSDSLWYENAERRTKNILDRFPNPVAPCTEAPPSAFQ